MGKRPGKDDKAATPGSGKKQKRGRRSLSEQARRAIATNFPSLGEMQISQHVVDGLSMLARVKQDKEQAAQEKRHLSGQYWHKIREQYGVQDEFAALVVRDAAEAVDPHLISALERANNPNAAQRSKKDLGAWMASVATVGQRSLVGLLKFLSRLKPATSPSSAETILAFMKLTVRLDLRRQFPQEIGFISGLFDEALLWGYQEVRKQELTNADFMNIYRDVACLVFDVAAWDRVQGCNGRWSEVSQDLASLCSGSKVGLRAYQFARGFVLGASLHERIVQACEALVAVDHITEQQVQEEVRKLTKFGAESNASAILAARREILVRYRNVEVTMLVSNYHEEISLRLSAHIKGCLAGKRSLPELPFDKFLAKPGAECKAESCDDHLAREWVQARNTLGKLVDLDVASGSDIKQKMEEKLPFLTSIDRSMQIELKVLEALQGPQGDLLVEQSILAVLPTASRSVELAKASSEIDQLKVSGLFKMVGPTGQNMVVAVQQCLQTMQRGGAPPTQFMTSSGMAKVVPLLSHFCRHTIEKGGSGGKDKVLEGAAAASQKLKELKVKVDKKSATFSDTEDLHRFEFLLSTDQQEQLRMLTKELLGTVAATSSKAAASSSTSKAAATKVKDDKAKLDVMALFAT